MKYFIMKEDMEISKKIEMEDFKTREKLELTKEGFEDLKDFITIFVKGDKKSTYVDFIEAPMNIVSEKVRNVFEMYENTILYKTVILSNVREEEQEIYRVILTEVLDCISEKTMYYKNGVEIEEEIVLIKEKIGEYNVFQIQGKASRYIILSLEVVESMLRRGIVGVKFVEIKVE
jgi:hypothetical protein